MVELPTLGDEDPQTIKWHRRIDRVESATGIATFEERHQNRFQLRFPFRVRKVKIPLGKRQSTP